ncbi:MAG: alpha/beta hydrolase family protein [Candidatus Woesearchaeota archaeon]
MSRRVSFTNKQGLTLQGVLHPSPSQTILVMAHGFTGDKDEWGFFTRIAENVHVAGFAVLRFDFSGCGESDDCSLTIQQHISDLSSAIAFAKQEGYSNVFLYGHSLGGYVSLLHHADAASVIATAPVTNKPRYAWSKRYNQEQLRELAEHGRITKNRDKGVRKQIIIDEQMLREREEITPAFLADITCPVLIIHGKQDQAVPLEDSLEAIMYLSKDSHLEIIPGANHGFDRCWDAVVEQILSWLRTH